MNFVIRAVVALSFFTNIFAMETKEPVLQKLQQSLGLLQSKLGQLSMHLQQKLPIVYSPDYNISFYGLEYLHPFDSKKYGKVFQFLLDHAGMKKEQFVVPTMITDQELLRVHTEEYLKTLEKSAVVAGIAQLGALAWLPNSQVQKHLLNPMRLATEGTIQAAELALKYGWAINLSGGYHHAKANSGGGFCFFADIPLAIYKVLDKKKAELSPDAFKQYKVLIVDLDAHQGNGNEDICGKGEYKENIDIFDIFNEQNYPHDEAAKAFITYKNPVKSGIKDAEYLGILETELPKALEKTKPKLIIYNAGTDIFENDPIGGMKISAAGIIKRDEIVFTLAHKHKIPIVMVLSGGYTKQSADIIGKSIHNFLSKVLKVSGITSV